MTFGMPTESMPSLYEPMFGLVVQGAKRAVLGNRVFDCVTGQYIVVSQEFPVTSQVVSATAEEPFMTVSLKLKPTMIAELLLDADSDAPTTSFSGMGIGLAPAELVEAVARLLRLSIVLGTSPCWPRWWNGKSFGISCRVTKGLWCAKSF